MASVSCCPSFRLTGWCVTAKAPPDINHCRKTWHSSQDSQPGKENLDMAMNGVGCRATARIMGVGLNTILRHQAAVGNLAHTAGQ